MAGVIAIGLLAATLAGNQMLAASALAQNSSKVSTSSIDIDCPAGSEICAQQIDKVLKSTITTSGTATVKVKPDKVTVTVGVETEGKTASVAATSNAQAISKVITALKAIGIKDDQISTSYDNVYPVYEMVYPPCILEGQSKAGSANLSRGAIPDIYPQPPACKAKNEIVGYKASNSLSITVDASQDIGGVIDASINAGANNINGAYFFVSEERQHKIRDSLIENAINNAKDRAQKAANAVSMNITGVQSINLNDVNFPIYFKNFESRDASSAGTQILPGEQEISTSINITFYIK